MGTSGQTVPVVAQDNNSMEVLNSTNITIPKVTESLELNEQPIVNAPDREDIRFIKTQINRYRENAKSRFTINNTMKAVMLTRALDDAQKNNSTNVREDRGVQRALATHRIFGFFGWKKTTATLLNEASIKASKPSA